MSDNQTSNTKALFFYFLIPLLMFHAPLAGAWGFLPFFLICLIISIDLTYQGFARQDRFALSHKHPLLNSVLNGLLITLPFASMLSLGIAFILPVLLVIHIISVVRSPAPAEIGLPPLQNPAYRYAGWAVMYCVGLGGYILKEYILVA